MSSHLLVAEFDRLAEAPDAIPRLRRFVLDLAVRGKLVEHDPREQPASALLKQIRLQGSERLATKGRSGVAEASFAVPVGWESVALDELASKLGAGSTPLGGKSVYERAGVPFLRSQNVHNGGIRLEDVAFISQAVHDRMSGTHIHGGDLLLNITGASIGRCAKVPEDFGPGNVSQHVAIIRLLAPEVRDFVHLTLISPPFQTLIDDVQVGVSRAGLSMQRLRRFSMPLPPLAEQQRIAVKVGELMELCDRLEAIQRERESYRQRLLESVLHSALVQGI